MFLIAAIARVYWAAAIFFIKIGVLPPFLQTRRRATPCALAGSASRALGARQKFKPFQQTLILRKLWRGIWRETGADLTRSTRVLKCGELQNQCRSAGALATGHWQLTNEKWPMAACA
jgi:hypothetical protein